MSLLQNPEEAVLIDLAVILDFKTNILKKGKMKSFVYVLSKLSILK